MDDLKIDNILLSELLEKYSERVLCKSCNRTQANFCCFCEQALNHNAPSVSLPLNVDIYRHWNEKPQNSTTVYCSLVAPLQTKIYCFNDSEVDTKALSERYPDPSRVVLLYPTPDAVDLRDLDRASFDTLAVIDGTWNQAKPMSRVFGGMGFRHVRISSHETMFWRFQSLDRTYLATIEAIYWFFRDYHEAYHEGPYDGRYDDLLFYFKLKYKLIQKWYNQRPNKPFTPRHALAESYVTRNEEFIP